MEIISIVIGFNVRTSRDRIYHFTASMGVGILCISIRVYNIVLYTVISKVLTARNFVQYTYCDCYSRNYLMQFSDELVPKASQDAKREIFVFYQS